MGEPVPDDVQRLLNQLVAGVVQSTEVLDIYTAAVHAIARPVRPDAGVPRCVQAQSAERPAPRDQPGHGAR
ncbi:MAG: DUF3387 domain-containing protein [Cellulomonas sp.]|uniref:hypothetical protein n=1 Tax=Cellulomonas sp. TaxID=40001 RepID=UPI00258E67CD|nr:hypothetical protein [Cellulomonas sp.]MCR6704612.1 DUF3387 domain-containing protein [Cellulomonas sp.]